MSKDAHDQSTGDFFSPKRPVGRPPKPGAMSNADRQRAYRARNRPDSAAPPAGDLAAAIVRGDCFEAEVTRLYGEIRRLQDELKDASAGWPSVLEASSKAHLQEEIWRLKHAQLVRVIKSAGLALPEGH